MSGVDLDVDNYTISELLGILELESLNLAEEKEKIKQQFSDLKNQELELVNQIKTKYGEGSISLETGEFSPVS